ncbi:hypothetical protein ACJX0J_030959, partial [Zea mays]
VFTKFITLVFLCFQASNHTSLTNEGGEIDTTEAAPISETDGDDAEADASVLSLADLVVKPDDLDLMKKLGYARKNDDDLVRFAGDKIYLHKNMAFCILELSWSKSKKAAPSKADKLAEIDRLIAGVNVFWFAHNGLMILFIKLLVCETQLINIGTLVKKEL